MASDATLMWLFCGGPEALASPIVAKYAQLRMSVSKITW